MKHRLLLLILGVALAGLMTSCGFRRMTVVTTTNGGQTAVMSYSYWYYPTIGCYYDTNRRVYFYSENNSWHQAAQLPPRYALPNNHVMVSVKSDRPYVDYDQHRAKYPAPKPMKEKGRPTLKKAGEHGHKGGHKGDKDGMNKKNHDR